MACELIEDAAQTENEVADSRRAAWGPTDVECIQFRLRAIARCRPNAVAAVLEHWLATPSGESDFDVRS